MFPLIYITLGILVFFILIYCILKLLGNPVESQGIYRPIVKESSEGGPPAPFKEPIKGIDYWKCLDPILRKFAEPIALPVSCSDIYSLPPFHFSGESLKKHYSSFQSVIFNDNLLTILNILCNTEINYHLPGMEYYDGKECVFTKRGRKECYVFGMDCEKDSTSNAGSLPEPATLQLAKPNGSCYILQLKHITKYMNIVKATMRLLNKKGKLLVGVGICEDCRYLSAAYDGLDIKGWLDLRHMAKICGYHPGSLRRLSKDILGVKIKKNEHLGPWEQEDLTEKQIKYAAQDAQLSVFIFLKLNDFVIKNHYLYKEGFIRSLREESYWKLTLEIWEEYIDKPFIFS